MPKVPKQNHRDSDQDSGKSKETGPVELLSKLERLQSEFGKKQVSGSAPGLGDSAHDEIARELLDQSADLIDRIINNQDLSRQDRLKVIQQARDLFVNETEKLEPAIPDKAPELWRDRNKSLKENPYQFAYRVYRDCFGLLTRGSALRKLDSGLTTAIFRHDEVYGPPRDHTYIPTIAERDSELVESVTWDDIMATASKRTKKLLKAYRAAQSRKQRLKNAC